MPSRGWYDEVRLLGPRSPSATSGDNDNDDNDNDNDTLREVPHQSNEGLALQARVSGPWPSKKNLSYCGSLLLGKVCKNKLLWTECNAS